MPRRKPISAKQRKAELQVKRAIKRGDTVPENISSSRASNTSSRRGGRGPRGNKESNRSNVDASRRLESSYVKFSRDFLEEAKRKASILTATRPIPIEKLLLPLHAEQDVISASRATGHTRQLNVLKRPKWNYDMSKKEVENNEAALFKRWLDETDQIMQSWKIDKRDPDGLKDQTEAVESQTTTCNTQDSSESMPYAPPLFERNLEVWRQLWRVTEICQVLLVLLDSRCPPLHYPPTLGSYLSSLRPPRKIIFVLTKIDITGPRRTSLWKEYLRRTYPDIRVVTVENYVEKSSGEGQGKRVKREPYIPAELRSELVEALKGTHQELCSPPPHIASDAKKLANWRPRVIDKINWNKVLNAVDSDVILARSTEAQDIGAENDTHAETEKIEEFLSVGLIGQPNVGKSSLLNALFGSHKVKASKTPGKTKHFQTLFWSKQIRLVDCPGLVFPAYTDLEMQVLAGILPISQMPAIPSSAHYALQYLPLEKILGLQHPAEKEVKEDKRTWRSGTQPGSKSDKSVRAWTAMDVLTAYAEKNNWITAKAGRPDVNRAGNAILRALAEGRIKWAFYPPNTDLNVLANENKGLGIWIEGNTEDYFAERADSEDEDDSEEFEIRSSNEDTETEEEEEEGEGKKSESHLRSAISSGTGMFGALTLEDDGNSAESD
ncbi:P-loop containing nucleoside triphosphate hydrolase protein [Fomitiporia mediterranea MF3/22]|uniref:P-loop containing nucleoside triphosphate hydrolase protein n=1 Tax=Fomitiporia mediterranea (strain MF3/22) TaxID=694068 RepID=UPI0004409780|nr:P-loop containing nucleoside triphosphate hydrolase protein [Fomitiporia mediterranea MF3/22]EJD03778.1 P-loop containing nucleoside triphosphate hydrolase protein [Fomitiporia mediterranea MF3/22]